MKNMFYTAWFTLRLIWFLPRVLGLARRMMLWNFGGDTDPARRMERTPGAKEEFERLKEDLFAPLKARTQRKATP